MVVWQNDEIECAKCRIDVGESCQPCSLEPDPLFLPSDVEVRSVLKSQAAIGELVGLVKHADQKYTVWNMLGSHGTGAWVSRTMGQCKLWHDGPGAPAHG